MSKEKYPTRIYYPFTAAHQGTYLYFRDCWGSGKICEVFHENGKTFISLSFSGEEKWDTTIARDGAWMPRTPADGGVFPTDTYLQHPDDYAKEKEIQLEQMANVLAKYLLDNI